MERAMLGGEICDSLPKRFKFTAYPVPLVRAGRCPSPALNACLMVVLHVYHYTPLNAERGSQ
jgi:hypothetical protein